MISSIRQHLSRTARFSLGLFVVLWIGMVIAPCAMAHVESDSGPHDSHHDCPHCPPKPCHQKAEPVDCDDLEPADRLRSLDSSQFVALLSDDAPVALDDWPDRSLGSMRSNQQARDGPRPHLIFQRFKE